MERAIEVEDEGNVTYSGDEEPVFGAESGETSRSGVQSEAEKSQ